MERVTTPARGYILHDREQVEQLLALEAELLRSEGVDPEWPGFDSKPDSS
jgi:hypothetical protein